MLAFSARRIHHQRLEVICEHRGIRRPTQDDLAEVALGALGVAQEDVGVHRDGLGGGLLGAARGVADRPDRVERADPGAQAVGAEREVDQALIWGAVVEVTVVVVGQQRFDVGVFDVRRTHGDVPEIPVGQSDAGDSAMSVDERFADIPERAGDNDPSHVRVVGSVLGPASVPVHSTQRLIAAGEEPDSQDRVVVHGPG